MAVGISLGEMMEKPRAHCACSTERRLCCPRAWHAMQRALSRQYARVLFVVAVDVDVGRRGEGRRRDRQQRLREVWSARSRRLVHREERRLQYVAVGGVAIGGGRWRVTTVRCRNGAAVVRVGGRDASGKRGEVQKPLGEFEGPRHSAARAAQSDICAEIARGMRCSGLSQDAHPRTT